MKPKNLSELLRSEIRDNPRGSEAEIRQACFDRCVGDPDLIGALFSYWFGNSFRDFAVIGGSQQSTAVVNVRRTQQTREAIETVKQTMRACLMDHALSDGTPLRSATFAQCAFESNWMAAVAKVGRASEVVGKQLTEQDLQNIRARHHNSRHVAR